MMKKQEYHGIGEIPWELRRAIPRNNKRASKERTEENHRP